MKQYKGVAEVVKKILTDEPATRDSDDLLYYKVCSRIVPGVRQMTFYDVTVKRALHGIPPHETIRRARQKVQADYPELRGTEACLAVRRDQEIAYRAFARGEV